MTTPRRFRGRPWLLLLVVAGAVLAWRLLAPGAPAKGGADGGHAGGHGGGGAQSVGVAAVARGTVRVLFDGLGTVTPLANVTVRTQINGQLMQVGFREGQIVRRGDFLAQIDPRPYQVALEQAQGALARDEALLREAEIDLRRYQTLLRQQSIAEQQVDTQTSLVAQYRGTVITDQAAIDQAKLNLVYCHITAPVDGRVGLRAVDPGNYVQTSDANGLVVLTELNPISVIFSLPEDELPAVEAAVRARGADALPVFALDRADANTLATGRLETTDNVVDTTTGTVRLRAVFGNGNGTLFPSQFVNARLEVEVHQNVVTIPAAAIQRGEPGTFAYVVGADNKVAVRKLQLGPQDGDTVEVQGGLQPGEQVVVDGADRLRDGAPVRVAHPGGANGGKGRGDRPAPQEGNGAGAR